MIFILESTSKVGRLILATPQFSKSFKVKFFILYGSPAAILTGPFTSLVICFTSSKVSTYVIKAKSAPADKYWLARSIAISNQYSI